MLWYGKAIRADWIKQGTEGKPEAKRRSDLLAVGFKVSTERALMAFF